MHSPQPRYSKLLPCRSIQAAWQHIANVFAHAEIDCARQEARLILQHVTQQSPADFFADLQRRLPPDETHQVEAITRRRLQHEPLQYILNTANFYGREFYVDSRVLIPRPETELLVETVRDILPMLPGDPAERWLADVGTGSGCVAVTLASEIAGARVMAIDSSRPALQVAGVNARRHSVGHLIHLVHGDLLSAVGHGVHVVAANPPYIPSGDIEALSTEVSRFEPRNALDGGPDGLHIIRHICTQASRVLHRHGWIVMEIGAGQSESVLGLLMKQDSWDSLRCIADLSGIPRIVMGRYTGSPRP